MVTARALDLADRKGSSQQDAISKVVEAVSNQDGSSQVPVDGFGLLGNGIVCKGVERNVNC
jgi:hypothetical protein